MLKCGVFKLSVLEIAGRTRFFNKMFFIRISISFLLGEQRKHNKYSSQGISFTAVVSTVCFPPTWPPNRCHVNLKGINCKPRIGPISN